VTASGVYRHEALAVVLQVRGGELHVLLWRRELPPQAGRWSLPGGVLLAEERLGTSVARHLAEKVDVREVAHLEQLETRSDPRRDQRGRIIATAYLGLVPQGADPRLPADTSWYPVVERPPTAFDHGSLVDSGVARLRAKLSYTNIGFALAPAQFTIAQLRRIYVAALDQDVSATNLLRLLTRRELIEPAHATAPPGRRGGRPAAIYQFRSRELRVSDPSAMLRAAGSGP
jgi:ADP-ribose pyrophosphatase YjhB (NUDIX family)